MKRFNLNFEWKYADNFKDEYTKRNYDDKDFKIVNIPHTNIELPYNNFDESMFAFSSCYRKDLNIPKELEGKKLILKFEACASYAQVYINGEKVGEHKGGYTSFEFDISKKVDYGQMNNISVHLDSSEREEIPPFGGVIDYLTYGGIYREIYLYVYENHAIKQIKIMPKNIVGDSSAQLDILCKFNYKIESSQELKLKIKDEKSNCIKEKVLTIDKGDEQLINLNFDKNIKIWDIDNPNLYTLEVDFMGDSYIEKFGFREAKFTKKGFFLNGKHIKIRALNRHQAYPYVGYAMPKSAQEADAIFLKENLGVNLVRTSHYPNSKHFLNKCDEIGLLVFTEIPGWQFVSKIPEWREITKRHVEEMINDDFNHPSIVLWGVRINESADDDELYEQTNKIARSLDPTRQTAGVRCIPRSHLLEDVYTYNDFIHSGNKMALLPKWVVTNPKSPYLVTEHNGHMFPTKSFDHEKKRQEHALRHARVLNRMYKSKGISGAIGWCMSDYNTHKDFGSGDKICYHGVSDMFRIEKLAAYTYKSQQDKYPVLEITSNMEIGDVAGGQTGDVYILTNCDTVKLIKNGEEIVTYNIEKLRKKNKEFKYMPHPPIKVHDVIGNQLEKDPLFKGRKRDCEMMKKLLMAIKQKGAVPAVISKPLTALYLMAKYKLGVDGMTALFGKYVISWGDKQDYFKFVGYKDGKMVTSVEKGAVDYVKFEVFADNNNLVEKETYDVTRVVVKAKSQLGNVLPYASNVIKFKTGGPIELIGPCEVSLKGGVIAAWVKTSGESGPAVLEISCEELNFKQEIKFNVVKEIVL